MYLELNFLEQGYISAVFVFKITTKTAITEDGINYNELQSILVNKSQV